MENSTESTNRFARILAHARAIVAVEVGYGIHLTGRKKRDYKITGKNRHSYCTQLQRSDVMPLFACEPLSLSRPPVHLCNTLFNGIFYLKPILDFNRCCMGFYMTQSVSERRTIDLVRHFAGKNFNLQKPKVSIFFNFLLLKKCKASGSEI